VLFTSDYAYALPSDRIAQAPADRRDESKLLLVDRSSGTFQHRRFADLVDVIPAGDAIAINTTRVFRARLLGTRDSGAPAEVFLLRATGEPGQFEALVHPGGKLREGRVIHVGPGLDVRIEAVTDRRTRIVRLLTDEPIDQAIERHGHVPLPPYIHRGDATADVERYQTVYAKESGSVAAPTAGLHFTPDLLSRLRAKGVERIELLLHVGAGTFKPVEVEDPSEHVMHSEHYEVTPAAAEMFNAVRRRGDHIWAVGTTSARTLETVTGTEGVLRAATGETNLFIRPGYTFRAVDRLITNFHLPRSTLLMLVAAFAGYDLAMESYRVALANDYRFYSYGDAMVII
jgi:S-adenosylmethionine:tRNA ribosyltransferase-isomerase